MQVDRVCRLQLEKILQMMIRDRSSRHCMSDKHFFNTLDALFQMRFNQSPEFREKCRQLLVRFDV